MECCIELVREGSAVSGSADEGCGEEACIGEIDVVKGDGAGVLEELSGVDGDGIEIFCCGAGVIAGIDCYFGSVVGASDGDDHGGGVNGRISSCDRSSAVAG